MKACVRNGYQVSLLCRGKGLASKSEMLDRIRVRRISLPGFRRAAWAVKAATFPLFFNPIWVAGVIHFLRKEAVDLLVVRDLPLAFLAGALGKMFRIPVILDMAENYPAALMAYQNAFYGPFLFRNALLPRQYERASLKLMDHTFVVTDEQARRLEALGIAASKITVVGNTPETDSLSAPFTPLPGSCQKDNEKGPNLLFVGKLDAHRGIDLLIRALPALQREFPGLTLTLVGDGTERVRLGHLANSLGVGGSVQLTGWVEFKKIWTYIAESTVCLIPHLRTEHTDTTLPNKLFDYMALGKPVIASNCAPLERVVRETGCGLIFLSGDVTDLQEALRKVLSNTDAQSMMGRSGRQAIREKYNWGVEEKILLNAIEKISIHTPAGGILPSRA